MGHTQIADTESYTKQCISTIVPDIVQETRVTLTQSEVCDGVFHAHSIPEYAHAAVVGVGCHLQHD